MGAILGGVRENLKKNKASALGSKSIKGEKMEQLGANEKRGGRSNSKKAQGTKTINPHAAEAHPSEKQQGKKTIRTYWRGGGGRAHGGKHSKNHQTEEKGKTKWPKTTPKPMRKNSKKQKQQRRREIAR